MALNPTALLQSAALSSLESRVAQCFMVGYAGTEPSERLARWAELGLGGIILFQENVLGLPCPGDAPEGLAVARAVDRLLGLYPAALPRPIVSVDQEGGPVERLTFRQMPSGISPMAIALSAQPEALAGNAYDVLAKYLAALGFTMNFAPTLDVNAEKANPIIGVRSFGSDPERVATLGRIAVESHVANGVCPVIKHFPGHGYGTVDSHLDLPRLVATDGEMGVFRQLVAQGVPAVLVAHGFYPALQDAAGEAGLPSSASPTIVAGLLRRQMGFDGLVLTDDMCMGAITRYRDPAEAAILSLQAGVDMLLYKQSTETEWAVFEAVVAAYRSGTLDEAALDRSVARILSVKARFPNRKLPDVELAPLVAPARLQAEADAIAGQALTVVADSGAPGPESGGKWWVIHPDRTGIHHYVADVPLSPELPACLPPDRMIRESSYGRNRAEAALGAFSQDGEAPDGIVFVAYNAVQDSSQQRLWAELRRRFPRVPVGLVSASTPYDADVLDGAAWHVALCTYRPASIQRLARWIAQRWA